MCEGDTALFPAAVYVPEQWSGLEENICFRLNLLVEAAEETEKKTTKKTAAKKTAEKKTTTKKTTKSASKKKAEAE